VFGSSTIEVMLMSAAWGGQVGVIAAAAFLLVFFWAQMDRDPAVIVWFHTQRADADVSFVGRPGACDGEGAAFSVCLCKIQQQSWFMLAS
jgi:hypothetical protein